MNQVNKIHAREILDSRGHPTIEVDITLENGILGRASVPSGASTGAHEAVELRDNDKNRYAGKGTLKAINSINTEIAEKLLGVDATRQRYIDEIMIELDGTYNKKRLGANATLGVSLAVSKAGAAATSQPLYQYISDGEPNMLPLPMMNIINGGEHANNDIDIQEFMIMPVSAHSFKEACQIGCEIYHVLKEILESQGFPTAVGDEGGFAPNLSSSYQTLDLIMLAISNVGLKPGKDIYLSIDCASTEYFDGKHYNLKGEGLSLSVEENRDFLEKLVNTYPIISIEDGMSEDDWHGWELLSKKIGGMCHLVGDDLFVTNKERLQEGINKKVANSILIKPNQIGTLTETINTVRLAQNNGYSTIMSHRSGETEDTTISDLAVGLSCGQIKTGSLSRSDRVCKYNQLIRIEEELGSQSIYYGRKILESIIKP